MKNKTSYQPSNSWSMKFFPMATIVVFVSFFLGLGAAFLDFGIDKIRVWLFQWDKGRMIYFFLLPVIWMGLFFISSWLLNQFILAAIKQGKCRSPFAARILAFLSSLGFYLFLDLGHYMYFQDLHLLALLDHLFLRGTNLQNPYFYLAALIEFIILSYLLTYWAKDHALWPFCEDCLKWFEFRAYISFNREDREKLMDAFQKEDWKNLPDPLDNHEKEKAGYEIHISMCPSCRFKGPAQLILCEIDKDDFALDLCKTWLEKGDFEEWWNQFPSGKQGYK